MNSKTADKRQRSLRRLAIQIATQLPDDPEDIRQVLDYVYEIARCYLAVPRERTNNVISLTQKD
jgi:hypothetical protein